MRIGKLKSAFKRILPPLQYSPQVPTNNLPPEYLEKFKKAEEALKNVEVPGYGVDIVSSGVVKKLSLVDGASRLVVYVDYTGSDPVCYFCRFLNNYLWQRIVHKAREELKKVGFDQVTFMDFYSGLLLEE